MESCTYKVLHRSLAGLIDSLKIFEYEVGVTVNNGYANFFVVLILCAKKRPLMVQRTSRLDTVTHGI